MQVKKKKEEKIKIFGDVNRYKELQRFFFVAMPECLKYLVEDYNETNHLIAKLPLKDANYILKYVDIMWLNVQISMNHPNYKLC